METNDDGSDGEAIIIRRLTHDKFAPKTTELGVAFFGPKTILSHTPDNQK